MKILQNHGWRLDKIKGSHHIFEKDGFKNISVPIHGKKELKYGLEISILNKADIK